MGKTKTRLKPLETADDAKLGELVPTPPYQPTPAESAAVAQYKAMRDANPALPPLKVKVAVKDGVANNQIGMDHPDPTIAYQMVGAAIGTGNHFMVDEVIKDLSKFAPPIDGRTLDMSRTNSAIAIVQGIAPRDTVETLLAVQMAGIHQATIRMIELMNCKSLTQLELAEKAVNRLARTYVAQVEGLKRYRSTGEQRVTVTHVDVREGGQAIVGDVHQASRAPVTGPRGGGVRVEADR